MQFLCTSLHEHILTFLTVRELLVLQRTTRTLHTIIQLQQYNGIWYSKALELRKLGFRNVEASRDSVLSCFRDSVLPAIVVTTENNISMTYQLNKNMQWLYNLNHLQLKQWMKIIHRWKLLELNYHTQSEQQQHELKTMKIEMDSTVLLVQLFDYPCSDSFNVGLYET
jgi:hypothetical protein